MKNYILLFFILICGGCIENSVSIHILSDLDEEELDEMVMLSEDILNYPITFDRNRYGAITIDVHESTGNVRGRLLWNASCNKIAWSNNDPITFAHELGHALGLKHSNDPENLMYAEVGDKLDEDSCIGFTGVNLTVSQRAKMEINIELLNMCD